MPTATDTTCPWCQTSDRTQRPLRTDLGVPCNNVFHDAVETAPPAELLTTSAEGLVDAVIQLTHRIADIPGGTFYDEQRTPLRAQRDLVRAELVRRAGA